MGIGDDRGGAVGQDGLHELPGADQRAFQVDVGVQEAGENDFSGAVLFHRAGVGAHAHDEALRHGDIRRAELVGKHIDVGGVFQHQVRRFPARRRVDDAALFQQLAVDFAGVAFRHKNHSF